MLPSLWTAPSAGQRKRGRRRMCVNSSPALCWWSERRRDIWSRRRWPWTTWYNTVGQSRRKLCFYQCTWCWRHHFHIMGCFSLPLLWEHFCEYSSPALHTVISLLPPNEKAKRFDGRWNEPTAALFPALAAICEGSCCVVQVRVNAENLFCQ